MPYQVLLKEAHSLVDEIPESEIEGVVLYLKNSLNSKSSRMKSIFGVLPPTVDLESAKDARVKKDGVADGLERMFRLAAKMPHFKTHEKWSREEIYDRGI